MNIINYSAEPLNKLYSWLPKGLDAETVVFFPDAGREGRHCQPERLFIQNKLIEKICLVGCGLRYVAA